MAGSMPQGTSIPATNAQYLGGVAPSTPPTYNFTYDEARSRMMQRDVKSPAEIAAIKAALKTGPSTGMPAMRPSDSLGFSNGALPSPRIMSNTPTGMPTQPQQPNIYQQASEGVTKAMQGAQAGMGFTPMAVSSQPMAAATTSATGFTAADVGSEGYTAAETGAAPVVTARDVSAGQIAGADLGAYINPYESQVVGQTLSDIGRQRELEQMQRSAQATAAGAFGGSRHGIAEAETSRAFAEQAARTAAGLRQAGFDRATALAGQDIASRMQADLANQAAGLQAGTTSAQLAQQRALADQAAINQARQFGASAANVAAQQQAQQLQAARQFGAGAINQAALANQAAINQARQFGASQSMQAQLANQAAQLSGAQQRLSAGAQLGSLANLGFGMGQQIQDRMAQQGALQQALQQQLINAAKGQYAGYTGAPAQSLQYLLQAVGASPSPTTTTGTTNRGLFDYLALALGR